MSFENLSSLKNISVVEGSSVQELVDSLLKIKAPCYIMQVWSDGKKHYALVQSAFKLPQKSKGD